MERRGQKFSGMRQAREREILEKSVEILKEMLSPQKIILFGSRAKRKSGPASDFDIAVEGVAPSVRLEGLIHEKMDEIGGLYKIDVIYLKNSDPGFRDIVLKTGEVLYEKRN